jgi:glycosyltransferase involved in cell wall biosynthesis
MRKIRICVLHHTGEMGGGTKSFIEILQMLKDKYIVTACVPQKASQLVKMINEIGVTVQVISSPFPSLQRYSGSGSILSSVFIRNIISFFHRKHFINEIETCHPDVVIFNSIVTSISARFLPKGIKKICIVRETIVHKLSGYYFSRILNRYFDGVTFLAKAELDKMGLKNPITCVIPDSLREDEIKIKDKFETKKMISIPTDECAILFMGGISRIKGIITILKSFRYLPSSCHLVVAGSVDSLRLSLKYIFHHLYSVNAACYYLRLRRILIKSQNMKNIHFVGFQQDISNIMSASDIVVFPSSYVHQPRPCIEAGFYHKPVILSDFDETKEFFIDGYNALYFKPHSAIDLAKKIISLSDNKQLKDVMGENNYIMSQEYHLYCRIENKLQVFINQIVNS